MAIHKFSLIAEFEYDDENGEYPAPSLKQIEHRIVVDPYGGEHLGLKKTVFEVANGDLETAFGIVE